MATSLLETAAPKPSAETAAADRLADEAIARVLAAERDARAAVAQCALQAERELQAGRERARLITSRGAERAAAVQRGIERRLEAAAQRIAAERGRLNQATSDGAADAQRLVAAVETLADELSRGALAVAAVRSRREQGER